MPPELYPLEYSQKVPEYMLFSENQNVVPETMAHKMVKRSSVWGA